MERSRFLPFLIFSLVAHLAILLLWRADRGETENSAPLLTVFLPSVHPGASPAGNPLPPSAAPPSKQFPSRERASRAGEAPPLREELSKRPIPDSPFAPPQIATGAGSPHPPASPSGSAEGGGAQAGPGGVALVGATDASEEMGGGAAPSPPSAIGAAAPLTRAAPDYDRNPPPPYPRLAQERGLEGTVHLEVVVSASGEVSQLKVRDSSGHRILDRAALEAVRGWRFRPARLGDRPVEGVVLIPVSFTLRRS